MDMDREYFRKMAFSLQDELVQAIERNDEVNEYELIVFKYVFSSELGMPIFDDLPVEMDGESFSLHLIPDDLSFEKLRLLDDSFDRFEIRFMPNPYNLVKLKFLLRD